MDKIEFAKMKVKKEFEKVRKDIYSALWETNDDNKRVFEASGVMNIVTIGNEVSFDGEKTFINRREEKQIARELDKVEQSVLKWVLEGLEEESLLEDEKDEDELMDVEDFDKLYSMFKSSMKTCLLETIDEQISLCKELGLKEELFKLLGEKKRIVSSMIDDME